MFSGTLGVDLFSAGFDILGEDRHGDSIPLDVHCSWIIATRPADDFDGRAYRKHHQASAVSRFRAERLDLETKDFACVHTAPEHLATSLVLGCKNCNLSFGIAQVGRADDGTSP
jgi:glycine cleavage system aminomethyltransferase T